MTTPPRQGSRPSRLLRLLAILAVAPLALALVLAVFWLFSLDDSVRAQDDKPPGNRPRASVSISRTGDEITVRYSSLFGADFMIVGLERKRSGGSFTHFDSTVITTDTGTASSTSFGNIDAGYIYRGYVNECLEDVIEVECFKSTSGTITIPHPPDPTPVPSPSIDILNLASSIQEGDSDSFSVRAMNLESKVAYSIRVSTNNGDIGFERPCPASGDDKDSQTLSGQYSYTVNFTLEACDTTGGTVTATLRQGTSEVVSTTQRVTVTSRPNRPPTFNDGTSTTRSINEKVGAGTGVPPQSKRTIPTMTPSPIRWMGPTDLRSVSSPTRA